MHKLLTRSRSLTFVLLMASGLVFGVGSLNLFVLFRANIALFLENGIMVIRDGALEQLLGLIVYLALTTAAYVVFKACEYVLVQGLIAPKRPPALKPD